MRKGVNVIKTCFQETTEEPNPLVTNTCSRCGRASHQVEKCYASKHITPTIDKYFNYLRTVNNEKKHKQTNI